MIRRSSLLTVSPNNFEHSHVVNMLQKGRLNRFFNTDAFLETNSILYRQRLVRTISFAKESFNRLEFLSDG